jgi:3-phenylpropionate/cinnamic acid dioxygenase small subunit
MTAVLERMPATLGRDEVHDFYDDYFEALDDGRFEAWIDFFVEDCLYRIMPRENYEAGMGLCIMQGDSKAMLQDRVHVLTKTLVFSPRYCRRFYSGLRVVGEKDGAFLVRQNVQVIQTMINKPSHILACGVGHDRLVRDRSGALKFAERTLVVDTEMVANSFVYPA